MKGLLRWFKCDWKPKKPLKIVWNLAELDLLELLHKILRSNLRFVKSLSPKNHCALPSKSSQNGKIKSNRKLENQEKTDDTIITLISSIIVLVLYLFINILGRYTHIFWGDEKTKKWGKKICTSKIKQTNIKSLKLNM